MSSTLQYNTFWEILQNIGIEIPPIQRDYAQGREIEKVRKIRNKFLESIINALQNENNLSLDFVYGKIHGLKNEAEHARNKQAIQSLLNTLGEFASTVDLKLDNASISNKSTSTPDFVYLIPLDGQQRLTTLFLLHWYIAKQLNNSEAIQILSRFRYKTRRSSSSFLKLLTKEDTEINFSVETKKEEKLSDGAFFGVLKNNENFSMVWLADPTVNAMMVMLQEIHYKLQNISDDKLEQYWESLTDSKLIKFSFLDLKDFNLSDELYVKMNGRGKELSTFENFKAWLFGLIEDDKIIDTSLWETYKQNFDIEWNDIFWKYKADGVYDIDDAYFNYFKKSLLNDAVRNVEIEKTSFKVDTKLNTLIELLIGDNEFDWEFFKTEITASIKSQFDFLALFDQFFESNYLNSFSNFIYGTPQKHDWQSSIKNYITYSFINNKNKKLSQYNENDLSQFEEYHRIMTSLFDNSIIDNPLKYQLAIKEIDQLNKSLKAKDYNIYDWLENFDNISKSVFMEEQILEEILKYKLTRDSKWEECIREAEDLKYFERQLNFWFFKIGISINKKDFEDSWLSNINLKNQFKEVTNKMNLLFDNSGVNRKENFSYRIFERALLSRTDYLLNEKGYKCFGRDTGRDVSWKRLFFRDRNSEITNEVLKEIFDLDFIDAKSCFEQYIAENLLSKNIDNWRRSFVENPEIFNYLGSFKYIKDIENHGWVLIKDGYKTYIGEHYELFSLDFYLRYLIGKTIHPFYEIGYYPAPKNSLDNFPCAYLNWKHKNVKYAIDVKFLYNKYQLIFFCRDTDVINYQIERELTAIGLQRDKNYLYVTFEECSDCFDKILEIGEKLRQL